MTKPARRMSSSHCGFGAFAMLLSGVLGLALSVTTSSVVRHGVIGAGTVAVVLLAVPDEALAAMSQCGGGGADTSAPSPDTPEHAEAESASDGGLGEYIMDGLEATGEALGSLAGGFTTLGEDWLTPQEFYSCVLARNCFACAAARQIWGGVAGVGAHLYVALAGDMLKLLAAFFLLWIGATLLKALASPQGVDADTLWQQILNRSGAVLLVAVLMGYGASNSPEQGRDTVFDYTLVPILDVAGTMATGGSCRQLGDMSQGIAAASQGIICIVSSVHNTFSLGIAAGYSLIKTATFGFSVTEGVKFDLWPVITGVGIIIVFALLLCASPVYVLEPVFRLGMLVAIYPLLVLAWAFPISRSVAKDGLEMGLNGALHLMFVAIIASVVKAMILPGSMPSLSALDDRETAQKAFSVSGTGFLAMIGAGVVGWFAMETAGSFAQQFASGPKTSLAEDADKAQTKAMTGAVTGAMNIAKEKDDSKEEEKHDREMKEAEEEDRDKGKKVGK